MSEFAKPNRHGFFQACLRVCMLEETKTVGKLGGVGGGVDSAVVMHHCGHSISCQWHVAWLRSIKPGGNDVGTQGVVFSAVAAAASCC